MIFTDRNDRLHVDPEFVDSYIQRELKVAAEVVGESEPAATKLPTER